MKINIFIKKLIIITLGFMLSTVVIASEEAKYNIVHKTNIYEIRLYTERLAVETKYNSNSSAFRKLFKYISGANNNS